MPSYQPDLLTQIAASLAAGEVRQARELLSRLSTVDRVEILVELSPVDSLALFRVLKLPVAIETFAHAPYPLQLALLHQVGRSKLAQLLEGMSPDDRTRLLARLPAFTVQDLLSLLSADEKQRAVALLGYPVQSVGRLMTPHYATVLPGQTVAEALAHLRTHCRSAETLDVIYVTDEMGELLGDLRLGVLLLAEPTAIISTLLASSFVALRVTQDQEEAVQLFRRHARVALPVLDQTSHLLGVVTYDDIMEVTEQEQTEDVQKFGGSEALDLPYAKTGFVTLLQKRLGWLVILFIGELFTSTALAHYQADIDRATVLSLFMPLIISSGGNSGSQATSLIIRALALGELTIKSWWWVLRRELPSGLVLGAILGLIGGVRILLWQRLGIADYGAHYDLLSLTIALSLVGVVTFGTLTGSLLPFVLRGLKFDPASASAPFVATLVDVTGLIIYFSVASFVLHGTLL